MKHCEKQKVWNKIVSEAREMSEQEPMLASFYHATIIKHESLCAALSYILANKLNTASTVSYTHLTLPTTPVV